MVDFIAKEFGKISEKCIVKYAELTKSKAEEIQLVMSLDAKSENRYSVMKNYKKISVKDIEGNDTYPFTSISFLNVLGVKIDFKGYSLVAPPFIKQSIKNFADDLQCSPNQIFVWVIFDGEKTVLRLFKLGEYVKDINFDELFANTE
jgi:hypothetical protein